MSLNTPNLTRRERRIAARKAQILQAAARVFSEKGFARATTREIAQAADVSEGTLYNYFENKDDLLVQMLREATGVEQIIEMLGQGLQVERRAFITDLLRFRLSRTGNNLGAFLWVLPEMMHSPELRTRYYAQVLQPLLAAIERHLQGRMAQGEIRQADPQMLSRVLVGMIFGWAILMMLGDPYIAQMSSSPEALEKLLVDILILFEGIA